MTKTFCRAAVLILLLGGVARADDAWTLTTSDFKSVAVTPTAIDATTLTVSGGDATPRAVPVASVVQVTRTAAAKTPSGLVLCTADGGRLIGTPRRIDGANLVWQTDGVGDVAVPVEQALAVLRDRTSADGMNDARSDDQARLTTGDTIHGILTDAGPDAFVFTPATGDPVKVAPAAVASILFASPPGGRPAVAPPAYLVHVGGSEVACARVTLAAGQCTLATAAGGDVNVPWEGVDSIEHTGGPIAWLSARRPSESVYTPYVDGHFPARFDTTVTGGPIRFGGVTYPRGIGVHSRSKLVFAVGPGDRSFRTRYAIDGALPRADVDVRISVDGRVVHEQKGFTAGRLSPVVEADLAGAKTLTLEVDFGRGYDVQDRFNWIEPAVIRVAR